MFLVATKTIGTAAFRCTARQPPNRPAVAKSPVFQQMTREYSSGTTPNISALPTWTIQTPLVNIQRDAMMYYHLDSTMEWNHLLAHVLELDWDNGYRLVDDDKSLTTLSTAQQLQHLHQLLIRRGIHKEPLQYILGQWDFLDLTLTIRPPLLCPRPETEELVQMVVQSCMEMKNQGSSTIRRILDVGCGTGAIGIALLHACASTSPATTVTAIDIEPIAITTSMENAKRCLPVHHLDRYQAIESSILEFACDIPFDMVVSNPPYIPPRDMEGLDVTVKDFESHVALCGGGEDGMNIIRDIVVQLPKWCHSGAPCWLEVDPTHVSLLEIWLAEEKSVGVNFCSGYQDMFGLDRFVKLVVR